MSSFSLLDLAPETHHVYKRSKSVVIPRVPLNGHYIPISYPESSLFSSPFFQYPSWPGQLNPSKSRWILSSPFCSYFEQLSYVPDSFDIFTEDYLMLKESYPSLEYRSRQKSEWGLSHNSAIDSSGHRFDLINTSRLCSQPIHSNNLHYIYLHHSESLNYFHWLTEYLPRIYLLYLIFGDYLSTKITLASVGFKPKSFHIDSLSCFTDSPCQLMHYPTASNIPRSLLVHPPAPGWCATQYLRMMTSFIFSKLALDASCVSYFRNKIIFIMRGKTTKNNRDLSDSSLNQFLQFCNQNDIIPLDPSEYSFNQQISIFSCVNAVVGVHGAAFANQIFCSVNTKILEFVPLSASAIPTCYLSSVSECIWSCIPLQINSNGMLELDSDCYSAILDWLNN